MAVIWGLDLKEMQWGKFKSSYMFGNTDYHLRRTKFVVYQLAMIFCVVSESLGTAALSDYIDQQDYINKLDDRALEYNNDYVGVSSYNIFVGVYVATIFGSGFFFDLFWPERQESKSVKIAWRVCSVFACMLITGVVVAETIIVSTHSAYVTGVGARRAEYLLRHQSKDQPLNYSRNSRVIASLVFAWLGWPSVIASTIIMWMSLSYIDTYGPFSSHAKSNAINSAKAQAGTAGSDEVTQETKLNDINPRAEYPPARVEPGQVGDATTETMQAPPRLQESVRPYSYT